MLAIAPVVVLAAGMLLQLALGRWLLPVRKGWLAFACGLAALGSTLALVSAVSGGQAVEVGLGAWDRLVPVRYHVDGLSVLFMLMGTGIGSAILLYCLRYMEHEEGTTRFYALMLTFIAGLVNLVASANLLLAYLSWEIIGLCSYFLVGFWYRDRAAANGARKVLVMTHLPGYGFLAAVLLLALRSGTPPTWLWTDPSLAAGFTTGIFLLMLISAMAKSVIFPLHTWIPEAMHAPTPVSALLHSACYVKAGVYLIARTYSLSGHAAGGAGWPASWSTLVLALGCATMLVGALFALVQTDLKRLLAFSTISQLGHILTALGLGTGFGVAAGLFYCFSHGLFKGTLFLCAGAVQHAAGTRDMRKLGGLAGRMPGTALAWLIAACAIVGVPLTNGFVAKWLLYTAALNSGTGAIVVAVAFLASLFTAFYMLKATVSVFYGEAPAALAGQQVSDASPSMRAGMGALAGLCLLFGLAPQLLVRWVVNPAAAALGFGSPLGLSWLGIRTGGSGEQAGAGAVILLLALLVGWAVFRLVATGGQKSPRGAGAGAGVGGGAGRGPGGGGLLPAPVSLFTGGDPLPAGDVVTAADFADMADTTFASVRASVDPDPVYLAIWDAIRDGAAWCAGRLGALEERPLQATALLLVGLLALAWLVGI